MHLRTRIKRATSYQKSYRISIYAFAFQFNFPRNKTRNFRTLKLIRILKIGPQGLEKPANLKLKTELYWPNITNNLAY